MVGSKMMMALGLLVAQAGAVGITLKRGDGVYLGVVETSKTRRLHNNHGAADPPGKREDNPPTTPDTADSKASTTAFSCYDEDDQYTAELSVDGEDPRSKDGQSRVCQTARPADTSSQRGVKR